MQPPTLSDGTVVVDRLTEGDLDDIVEACQDPEIPAWTTVPSPYGRADAESFLDLMVRPGWVRGDQRVWAVRAAGEPRIQGVIGLHGVRDGSAEIGYWMAPWGRRRGLLGRAVPLVTEYAFDPSGAALARLTWSAVVGNWPSRRVVWAVGFRVEGTRRKHLLKQGERVDAWVGGLLREDPREPVEPWPTADAGDGSALHGVA
ncbi:GNAT family N-acetyltransferase [Actinotalea sp. M2MS4P-6]|uniref:GNAT family N-acetyltransferase n=1 Tax=Actinotalea sp. M2MS4P-6 TaxID=2983762 RepID=UPI0021E38050|nr:GNAT family protein [Actinotalea sp. M2MS4P-6]MCV2394822.1 GNAT family N-acetyltransferase [Actinotalea sp. M2MS4P-6]